MKLRMVTLWLACVLSSGCATTNFSTAPSPATVKTQSTRKGPLTWGGPMLFRVGNAEMGFGAGSGTYTVDSGTTTLRIWYYGNLNGFKGLFTRTDLVELPATLAPNGHYELRAWAGPGDTTVKFHLVDLGTNSEIAATGDIPIVLGKSR